MAQWDTSGLPMQQEVLFGDRVVTCRADRPSSCNAMFSEALLRAPDGEALIDGDLRFTWSQLDRMVGEVAGGLAALGIEKGDRVALLIGNRAEFVVLFLAILRLGAICVPISTREQGPGIGYMLGHCGAKLLLHEAGLADRLPMGTDLPHGVRMLAIIEPSGGDVLASLRAAPPTPANVDESDIALILYTSGTTGRPKGAMMAHVNVVHAGMIYEHVMRLGPGERAVVAVPLSHITGITAAIVAMARCAGTLIVMREFKAPDFLMLAAAERMTSTVLVPAMYALCLARADFGEYDLSSWRTGCFGGAPMPAPVISALRSELPGLHLINLYGSTETVCAQAIMPPQYALERRDWVGLPAPGGEILIMDEQGREVPRGTPGEIWLKNATVVPGYWKDPEASRANIIAGFWRSGDLGLMDEEGFVQVLDRIKDMINRGGYKIYTAEVESVLSEHPGVLESAVVAKPCPVLGERVHAFVALRGDAVTEEELKDFCAARLADYKRPETYTIQSEALPRNANGKLMKRDMRSRLVSSQV
jgi:long-chain acyl-CoA synthetase